MWSKKPTPVVAGAGAGAGQAERQRDVGLAGLAAELGGAGHGHRVLTDRHRGGVGGEAFGVRDRHAGARQRGRGVVEADLGHPAPEVADVEAGGEARGALGGQRVVRTRDVVAERGAGSAADEQAAGAADPRRERFGRRARELQVLGGQRLDEGQRGPQALGEHLLARVEGVEDRLVVADRDGQRALAVLGLGLQVERQRLDVGALRWRSRSGRTGRRSRRCRRRRRPAAWPPGPRGCRGRRSRRPAAPTRCRSAKAATAWAPVMANTPSTPHSRAAARITGCGAVAT